AAIMSIAASNLFTRNIYCAYLRPDATAREEAATAKLVSLLVKIGALAFIIFLPVPQAINFQLLGGVWILQTFPTIVLGVYTRWRSRQPPQVLHSSRRHPDAVTRMGPCIVAGDALLASASLHHSWAVMSAGGAGSAGFQPADEGRHDADAPRAPSPS